VRPFLILVALISLSGAALVTAQQSRDEKTFSIAVNVDLVVFNITVTDSQGHHVSGLQANDFQIYEEKSLQSLALFAPEDVPASVGLIIDNSGSMSDKSADVASAAVAFAAVSNSEDEMFVVKFNEKVYLALPPSIEFTSDPGELRSALLRSAPSGRTALYDALAAGIEHLKAGTRDRKALVVLSDGGDNASHRRLDDVLQIAKQSNATIYTIGIYDDSDPDRNPRVLKRIAALSGGRAFFPQSLKDLAQVWRDIAGAIRSQYTIGYHSRNLNRDGAFRKVRITASRNGGSGLRITTREGYTAPR
jgi:Ca-activated chloride channel family protein